MSTTELARAMWAPVRHAAPAHQYELPACMCGILRRAVEDAMAVEEMSGYRLNMDVWHSPNGVCKVCMAGAVMVKTLGVSRSIGRDPTDFDRDTEMKLYAVNSFRVGMVISAYTHIYGRKSVATKAQSDAIVEASELIKADFIKHQSRGYARWDVYLKAADVLEAVGL